MTQGVCKTCGHFAKNIGRHLSRNRCEEILFLRKNRNLIKMFGRENVKKALYEEELRKMAKRINKLYS